MIFSPADSIFFKKALGGNASLRKRQAKMLRILLRKFRTAGKFYSKYGFRGLVIRTVKKFTGDSSYVSLMPREFSEMDAEKRFEHLYESGHWGLANSESVSGAGSSLEYTKVYRPQLVALIEKLGIHSLFDAPCGDFNWMSKVVSESRIDYVGGDIVKPLIERNQEKYPAVRFVHFDITKDRFGSADLWHCRDCMIHLSFADILLALENFAGSDIEYALLTTHRLPDDHQNKDILSGDFRHLDLLKPPFCLPEPLDWLTDFTEGQHKPRYVGLWRRDQIAACLTAIREAVKPQ